MQKSQCSCRNPSIRDLQLAQTTQQDLVSTTAKEQHFSDSPSGPFLDFPWLGWEFYILPVPFVIRLPPPLEPAVVALVTLTTEDVPMWSFLRATCKEFGLIARHTDLFGASPCICLSLSPSQLLSRHPDPSLGPYHFAN